MKVLIPNNFTKEREYVLDVLLKEFVGIDFQLIISNNHLNTELHLNEGKLIIEDHFWNSLDEKIGYLHQQNIPEGCTELISDFTSESSVIVLYGIAEEQITVENNQTQIYCRADILASAFFMLTRWEEHVIPTHDSFGRVDEQKTFSVRNRTLHRPLVNEYSSYIINMLRFLGWNGPAKKHFYGLFITHDVDNILRFPSLGKYMQAIGGDFLSRRSISAAITTTRQFLLYKSGKARDPYDTFDYLMDVSEEKGLKSRFYFMPTNYGELDARYSIKDEAVQSLIRHINEREHVIGVHGSLSSFNNATTFSNELKRLQCHIPYRIEEGRQHYLMFENPTTWQIWESNGLKWDSTLGFHNDIGFRTGSCFSYSVFNILTRQKLILKENPLIIMEVALQRRYKNFNDMLTISKLVIDQVKKHNGNMVLLWHNNNFHHPFWRSYSRLYQEIVDYAV